MFSILPLQLAANVFIAETSDDLDRYYGFDKLSPPAPVSAISPPPSPSSYSLPPELASPPRPDIVELEVSDDSNRFILSNPPPNIRTIVLCDSADAVTPIQPGDLCVVSQHPKRPLAFFMREAPRDEEEDLDAVVKVLRSS